MTVDDLRKRLAELVESGEARGEDPAVLYMPFVGHFDISKVYLLAGEKYRSVLLEEGGPGRRPSRKECPHCGKRGG